MAEANTPTVVGIYRYPVKGLSAEALSSVALEAGGALPFDRAYAIENGPGRFDVEAPQHLPKIHFLMLMRDERLATLETRFDEATQTLTICRAGKPVVSGELSSKTGRALIEQFMAAYMTESLRGPPRIVGAPSHSFSDLAAKCIHIVNMASLRELERAIGRPVDVLRFRPNLVIDGAAPWAELSWVGEDIAAGGVRLCVLKRTERCAATNVDPATGRRDMDIPAALARKWGHTDFGVYAKVVIPGAVAVGDNLGQV
ncbi:MAG TPA: MOSC domain-containing protein [Hyphomicrobiaceae bacterium]|nr:MOSC domain-containing protein [Hyphomicrobiaceae bacterium]